MIRRRFFLLGSVTLGIWRAMPSQAFAAPSSEGEWLVKEDLTGMEGTMTLTGPDGRSHVLKRFMEECVAPSSGSYCGLDFGTLAIAERDLLAERLLAGGGDPDPLAVRAAAPPIDSRFTPEQVGRIVWTSFVAPPYAEEVMPLTPAGNTRNWHVNRIAPELSAESLVVCHRREGLLGGFLPIVVKQFPLGKGRYWEVLTFADVDPVIPRQVPTWTRMMLIENGAVVRAVYGASYIPFGPFRHEPSAVQFNQALARCVEVWHKVLDGTVSPILPDSDWADFARHAFVKEAMVRRAGVWPRYGVVDRDYEGSEYDGFQDIFTSSLLANLEWGRFAAARTILDNQFTAFVGDDGLVAMRGPEVGQTGLTLSLLARYLHLTGDAAILQHHADRIAAMASVLTTLHDQALALPQTNPGYGLLHGWSESDACLFPDPSVWWKPYFGNSAMAVRGWRDLAAIWLSVRPGEAAKATDWKRRADLLSARLESAVRAALFKDRSPPYVPILPGSRETFRVSLARHQYSEQQWAHRVYAEMLQAGVLPADLEVATINSMRAHGATVMGVVGNLTPPSRKQRDILGFISYGYAQALLRQDRIEEYLLFLYAHRYHAHTRGSWTAAEVAGLKGDLALFCLPAQMTVPILLRWALVYEDDGAEILHLARAIPYRWLLSGKEISVENAPTRWGRLSMSLRYEPNLRHISVNISLPKTAPNDVRLYLRLPSGMNFASAQGENLSDCVVSATYGVNLKGKQSGQYFFQVPIIGSYR
ncbi:Tat pathway signal protein [Gluconobacter kondonii]|uniref:Tat pathway signal protein n=1 Tax=Gluconobacter kondonii TaxID=941463 RepID=UPI0020A1B488|nr:Tat pathway signal protein [Gluconobacter kondonii]MCP1237590.1 Tat pathway signal protein [Gluconobacter kondonii]